MKERVTYIYALHDPRDGTVHYIGKSNSPRSRLMQHLEDKTCNTKKVAWIDELAAAGLRPSLEILDEVERKEWPQAERDWIAFAFAEGWPLTNISPGGCGGVDHNGYSSSVLESTIANYLMPHERSLFAALPYKKQAEICRCVAIAMLDLSWYAIKQQGDNPQFKYNEHKQFWRGSRVARALVHKLAAA